MKYRSILCILLGCFFLTTSMHAQEQPRRRAPRKTPEQRLIEAATANDLDTVRRLIRGQKLDPDTTYNYSLTPLQIAVSNNNAEMLQFLIRQKANVNLVNNRTTALHIAGDLRRIEMIALLYRAKANPSVVNSQGVTPLQLAANKEDMQVMQALMVTNNLRDISANNLIFAVAKNNSSRVKSLLNENMLTYNLDRNGYLPLHYAAVLSTPEVLAQLLPYYDINARTHSGSTAIMLASQNNRADLIPLLVEWRASLSEKNSQGNTPLHLAVMNNAVNAANVLIQLNAPTREVNQQGQIPLDIAQDPLKEILRANYDLPVAVDRGNTTVVRRLLRAGAFVNIAHTFGNRPLHIAVEKGHVETAKALIEAKADINITNDYGNAPIHVAATTGNMQMLDLLVKSRARINDRNRSLELPIQLAMANNHREAVILLKNLGSEINDGIELYLSQSEPPAPRPLNAAASAADIIAAQEAESLQQRRAAEAARRVDAAARQPQRRR
ncbi:MAG: ankyrin repeat domain-containing protein, partial [Brevinema sp.]